MGKDQTPGHSLGTGGYGNRDRTDNQPTEHSVKEQERLHKLEVVAWEGGPPALYLDDFRITGRETKPLGGGKTMQSWTVRESDILDALAVTAPAGSTDEMTDDDKWAWLRAQGNLRDLIDYTIQTAKRRRKAGKKVRRAKS